jgi:homoserine O-acetyltransferase
MTAASAPAERNPAPKPTFEGDFALPAEFPLEAGGVLRGARLRYVLYGEINAAKDNVVLVCHALSGSAQVAEWWPAIFFAEGLLDPKTDGVLGVNILGSCYGSTGPTSTDPATGKPYGADFPLVGVGDVVRAQALLLDSLGVARLKLAIGASIGGMQVLQWAVDFPERIGRAIAIAATPLNAMGLGLNHLQRQAIRLDPDWRDGGYSPDAPPRRGLALARELAVCSYKSGALFAERHGRKPDRAAADPWADLRTGEGRFDVAGYLDHQGEKFNSRFDANSYLAITRMMDLFDPARGFASPAEAWGRVQASLKLVGISSDWLFPAADVEALAATIQRADVRCEYRELVSDHGHDSFLAEPELLLKILTS